MAKVEQQRSGKQKERYAIGYDATAVRYQQTHTAAKEAGFFLPYLRSGMSLLDCGCGPGTVTTGLAEAIAPGQVTGIDKEVSQIEIARSHAAEKGISNLRFEVGDIYAISFSDDSFDAVFATAVLVHLRHQLRALREMYRILRPGGMIGIQSTDFSGHLLAYSNPLVGKGNKLGLRWLKHNGANLHTGRHQRGLLHKAGFVRIEASALYESYGTPESVRMQGEIRRL